jgi:hypothetical protein
MKNPQRHRFFIAIIVMLRFTVLAHALRFAVKGLAMQLLTLVCSLQNIKYFSSGALCLSYGQADL